MSLTWWRRTVDISHIYYHIVGPKCGKIIKPTVFFKNCTECPYVALKKRVELILLCTSLLPAQLYVTRISVIWENFEMFIKRSSLLQHNYFHFPNHFQPKTINRAVNFFSSICYSIHCDYVHKVPRCRRIEDQLL